MNFVATGGAKVRASRSVVKARREEVVHCLSRHGLRHVARRGLREVTGDLENNRRLRAALEELGPVFSAFGLYLATRVDLLSASTCLELSALPDRSTPMHPAAVHALIQAETGREPEDLFAEIYEPFESRLLYQSHRARLTNGEAVVVKLVNPEIEQRFLCDIELLHLLDGALSGERMSAVQFADAVADFTAALHRRIDLTREAKALESLEYSANDFQMLRAARVVRGLCTRKLLVVEELVGRSLLEMERELDDADSSMHDGRGYPPVESDRANLARMICSVWLQQALLGNVFPVEPRPENIVIISNRQIAFTGGDFSSLPAETQSNLWNYLLAGASDNPDRACACLLREMRPVRASSGEDDLRHRFRQVVPFRDSEWYGGGENNYLAEHLYVQWRMANECGFVPQPHLPSFFRGLFMVTDAARRLSPQGDPLLEGLQDARLLASLAKAREMLTMRQLTDHADRYASMLMGMPVRFDELLTSASEGNTRVRLHVAGSESNRRSRNSTAVTTSLLLLLAAIALLLPRVMASLAGQEWANTINTVVFLTVGVMALRAASKS